METTRRLYCCPPLADAMSADPVGAALVVRTGRDGALYFKIISGVHDSPDLNVSEPLAFCPFCGDSRDTAPASLDTIRIELPADEELTVVASRSPLILVGA